jgi:hypothetical protein
MRAVQGHRRATAILGSAHVQLRRLLDRCGRLGREEIRKRARLTLRIQNELRIHLELEEVLLHPALQGLNVALVDRSVTRAFQDHRKIKALLEDLSETGAEDSRCEVTMRSLRRSFQRHVELEGVRMLSHARALPQETLQELSSGMEELLERLRRHERVENPQPFTQKTFYPSFRDRLGAPEEDRGAPLAFAFPGESEDRYPSEFYGWDSL